MVGLHLIIGRAGTGKTYKCLENIRQEIRRDPLGKPLILCVPEQSTHQMELSLVHNSESQGILRAQVLSFQRLGWRVFAETGGGLEPLIGDIGKRMILRRLLLKYRQELRVFARTVTKPGMADLLARTIGELKTYQIDAQDLLIDHEDHRLKEKVHELAFLYEEFNRSIPPNMRDRDEELDLVAERIPASPSLQGAKIWLDGFKGFTPQEISIIESLLTTASEVTITLTLEPKVITGKRGGTFRPGEEIFWDSYQTYQTLVKMAQNHNLPIKIDYLTELKRFQHPALEHLEKYYTLYPTQVYSGDLQKDTDEDGLGIKLLAGANKRAEVEAVACTIRRLVREKGKRWRDIVVVTRDLAGYEDYLEQIFKTYEIPYFLDHKPPIKNHPLLELLNSLIELAQLNWAYEPLFRSLKTGFFPLDRDLVDRLENYCLAYGINHRDWSHDQDWVYRKDESAEELAQLNEARHKIHSLLKPFVETLRKNIQISENSLSVSEVIESLYQLLVDLQVPEQLKLWGEEAIEREDLAEAQLQGQIWEAMIQVFDEMVLGLGEEVLELGEFLLIFTSGLEGLKLGLIPPAQDQVLIGSLERSRNPETSYLFLIGANEGILPGNPSQEDVFDEQEREGLVKKGINLAPKGKVKVYEEYYFVYTALTRPREGLCVSYSLTDESSKGLTVSPVVQRLKTLFPNLKEEYILQVKKELKYIEHPKSLLDSYALELQNWRKGIPLSPLWQVIRSWYQENQGEYSQVNLLESSLDSKNTEEPLPKKLTQQLYGKRLSTSVTRMEQFARCPFAHFAQFGLKLKERDHFRLSFPDIGQFFHQVLYNVAVEIQEKGLNWGELSPQEAWQLVNDKAEQLSANFQNKLLLRNARYQFLTRKLKRAVHHAVKVLGEHARQGIFTPLQLEVRFGPDGFLPPLEIDLGKGNSLLIRGQIDRVDGAILDDQIYLRVFDYKSRISQVNLNQIYHGLDLQLLVYLEAALKGGPILTSPLVRETQGEYSVNVRPGGILYFPVFEPFIDAQRILKPEEIQHEQIKAVKVRGFLLSDKQVLEAMDQSLVSGVSTLLGVRLLKSGDFSRKGSPVLTEEQFSLLRQYLYKYLQDCGKDLLEGNIAIAPYKLGKDTGCQYCSFKPVCHFDLYLPENTYRNLSFIQDDEFWAKLREILQQEEEEIEEIIEEEAGDEARLESSNSTLQADINNDSIVKPKEMQPERTPEKAKSQKLDKTEKINMKDKPNKPDKSIKLNKPDKTEVITQSENKKNSNFADFWLGDIGGKEDQNLE